MKNKIFDTNFYGRKLNYLKWMQISKEKTQPTLRNLICLAHHCSYELWEKFYFYCYLICSLILLFQKKKRILYKRCYKAQF